MDPDEIPADATATKDAFDSLRKWLPNEPTTPDMGEVIPDLGVDPSRQNLGEIWKDVRFDVPEAPTEVDWIGWMQASFAQQYASDIYQGAEAESPRSEQSSSRSKSEPKQGA